MQKWNFFPKNWKDYKFEFWKARKLETSDFSFSFSLSLLLSLFPKPSFSHHFRRRSNQIRPPLLTTKHPRTNPTCCRSNPAQDQHRMVPHTPLPWAPHAPAARPACPAHQASMQQTASQAAHTRSTRGQTSLDLVWFRPVQTELVSFSPYTKPFHRRHLFPSMVILFMHVESKPPSLSSLTSFRKSIPRFIA